MQTKYHVQRGTARTTVSLDDTLSGLLSIKLGQTPGTPEAHSAVRTWLQNRLDKAADPGRKKVSQWLSSEAVLYISDKELSETYLTWLTGL